MSYTKRELYDKLIEAYAEQNLEGELVELVSGILSEYLYLHQMEDISILMEDSFLRCKLLNSKIQHAADNFYAVRRGSNRTIRIDNLGCLNKVNVKKYDTVSSYGQYKLLYNKDYSHQDLSKLFSFEGILSTDIAQVVTIKGNGKYFLDITDSNGDLVKNISDDLIVFSVDDRGTAEDSSDDVMHEFITTSNLSDLYTKGSTTITSDDAEDGEVRISDSKAEICVMTLPNYGVRLWKKDPFYESCTYTVKYLKSPDNAKPEIDINKDIRVIPGFTKNADNKVTHFEVLEPQSLKEDDLGKIFLLASSQQKFQGTMKSLNSIDEAIIGTFPELKGFKVVVGPSVNPSVQNGEIKVYIDPNSSYSTKSMNDKFESVLRAYSITNKVDFKKADTTNIGNLYIDITYNDVIPFVKCENIITDFKHVVGESFNPYQIIANLMSDEELRGKLSLVEVFQLEDNKKVYPSVTELQKNQCIDFNEQINYISSRTK